MKALEILNRSRRILRQGTSNPSLDEQDKRNTKTIQELDEAIAELEALQNRNCSNCKYCMYVYSYIYPLCTENESEPFQIHSSEKLKCDKWSSK